MKNIQTILNKRLINRHLSNIMFMHAGRKALKECIGENKYTIKVKNNTLFIIGGNNFQNINIFLKKKIILEKTNNYIKNFGFKIIFNNIIIKQ